MRLTQYPVERGRLDLFPLSLPLILLFACPVTRADCECGYRVTVPDTSFNGTDPSTTSDPPASQYVFTDLIETNFANISDVSKNTDWVRQAWNTTAEASRGTFGEMMTVDNVVTSHGGGGGLQITVRAEDELTDGLVPSGEIDSARRDLWYGTYRSSLKLTDVAGTVSAFFWYYNDTQEVDMEFLSKDFHAENASFPVNLVLQSRASAAAGADASRTPTYAVANLPFDPRADFHEYRVDFLPGRVRFLADGAVLAEMDDPAGVPAHAGHLSLNQWSNGNAAWSGGPPARDAVMEVRYVKAYFNSSDGGRVRDAAARCGGSRGGEGEQEQGAVCDIPEVAAGNDSAAGWFFSGHKNMTGNQTVSTDSGISGGDRSEGGRVTRGWLLVGASFAVAGWLLGL